jgi:hypothetical protein
MDLGFIKLIIEDKMITIPEGQLCQIFDPMMYLPVKAVLEDQSKTSTSCVAPAYVYIEGSRGKRFLCDYHYYYEKNMTRSSTPHLWDAIEEKIIDQRDLIKEVFAKNVTTLETLGKKCWFSSEGSIGPKEHMSEGLRFCNNDAFVKVKPKIQGEHRIAYQDDCRYYCNFHFRKDYYRYYSNGVIYEDLFDIVDERYRMTISVIQEAESCRLI